MHKIKIGLKKKIYVLFALFIALALFNPAQSFAQPQKYDGSKTYITIVFDHAYKSQGLGVFAMEKYKIPGDLLIVSGNVGDYSHMTWNELLYHQNHGFEMVDHSIHHPLITNITSEGKLVEEIVHSKSILKEHGLKVIGYLPPYDIVTPASAAIINQHYKWSFVPNMKRQNTVTTIQTAGKPYGFSIPTLIHLGVGVPPGPGLNNFTAAKYQIDYAIKNHTWLILNWHQIDDLQISYHAKPKLFMEILNYIKHEIDSKQLIPVTISQGLGMQS